jgi:ribonuclease D
MRVSRHRSLDRRGLAVLRELADWRETTAQRRNIPRSRVLKDEMLVELARRQPKLPDDMRALRRMHPREIERSGEEICEAVRVALELPEDEWPKLPPIPEEDPDLNVTADLLGVLLRRLARESSIAASYLATKKDLVRLISRVHDGRGDEGELRLLQGWRHELAGETLVRLLRGEIQLSVDPKTLRVVVEDR